MELQHLLQLTVERNASDLHLIVGIPPSLRVDGQLLKVPGEAPLTKEETDRLIKSVLNTEQIERLTVNKEIDLALPFSDKSRFRINAYYQQGTISAAFRQIPRRIPTLDEIKAPSVAYDFSKLRQGLILVTGPTGHGKSTTLAAILNEINNTRQVHILTIEDPVEFILPPAQSIISQREMRSDTHSWEIALRSSLREDPDVVLVGEMRDYETISAAITIAETGHLVFATLHTNSAAQSIDRIIGAFPHEQQDQIRLQLSSVLEGILSQRLIPLTQGGRILACEVLIATSAIRTAIREGKSHQIDNTIQTSAELGMATLDSVLASYIKRGLFTLEEGLTYSIRPEELNRLVKGS